LTENNEMEFWTLVLIAAIIALLTFAAVHFRLVPVTPVVATEVATTESVFLTPVVATESVGSGEKARDSDSKSDEKKKKRKRKQTKKRLNGGPARPGLEESEEMPEEGVAVGLLRARGISRKVTETTSSESSPARQTRQVKTTTGQSRAVIGNY